MKAEDGLMVDIKEVRNAFDTHGINNDGLVCSVNNPTDAFTKLMNFSTLETIMLDKQCKFTIEQWAYSIATSPGFCEKKSWVLQVTVVNCTITTINH